MTVRMWGSLGRSVAVVCAGLMLYVAAQCTAAGVGAVRHELGALHAADPLAGALVLNHVSDHGHAGSAPDPHSDYDGPPIEPDDEEACHGASTHHHHQQDGQSAVWIMSPILANHVPIGSSAHWSVGLDRLVGVTTDRADPPPRAAFAQQT